MRPQQPSGNRSSDLSDAMLDLLFESSTADLQDAFRASAKELDALAEPCRNVVQRAVDSVAASDQDDPEGERQAHDLRKSLGTLIQLLRRRERITEDVLAERAAVPVEQIRQLEFDPFFSPPPRTVYQLEQYFKLPTRTLVMLSGHVRSMNSSLHEAAVRFAAHSTSLAQLSRDEARLIKAFVAALAERVREG